MNYFTLAQEVEYKPRRSKHVTKPQVGLYKIMGVTEIITKREWLQNKIELTQETTTEYMYDLVQYDESGNIVSMGIVTEKDLATNRLELLRQSLRSESISYEELAELQHLAPFITPDDVELLEAAGIPEYVESEG